MAYLDKCVDLLIVQDGEYRHVVAAPAFANAGVGDLVEYIMPGGDPEIGFTDIPEVTCLGLVLKVMPCELFDNAYLCVAEIAQIRRAKAVYHCKWSRNEEEAQIPK